MRVMKKILSQLHTFVLWALVSAMFWSWVFTFVTDTSPDRKVTVYVKAPELRATELAVALEASMPEGLRMIQVHAFDYVMFGVDEFYRGDIFILPGSERETYAELLAPLDATGDALIYDAAAGKGVATEYIRYGGEDYFLYLGTGSTHLTDGKAQAVARALLALE